MQNMKNLLTFCLMVCCVAVQAQLVTYPEGLQTGMPHNDDYTVRVRVPGGDWKDLFEYNVQVDMDRVQDASMVQFDMGSPVEVMVKKNNGMIHEVDIRPQARKVQYVQNKNVITFTLDKPQYLSVEFNGNRLTLETECLRSGTLPSIAYGFKRCSQKHKVGPQEKFCNHHPLCRAVWQAGNRVTRFIGYDAGERKRYEHSRKFNEADKKYENRYPLIEDWHWTRDDCIRAIQEAGLPLPGKSSCFFCPSMKREEIEALKRQHPDLYRRALAIEENAMPHLKTVKGLGRNYAWKERYGME